MKKRKRLKSKIVYALGLIMMVTLLYITNDLNNKRLNSDVVDSYEYTMQEASTYEVYYSGSANFDGKTNKESFIRQYIDKIKINVDYLMNFSKQVSVNENYTLKATVVVYSPNSDMEIWRSNTDYLIPSTKLDYSNAKSLHNIKNATIDYKKYENIYNNFKKETSIISRAKILVEYVDSSIIKHDNIPDKVENASIAFDIPLNDLTITISKNTNVDGRTKVNKAKKEEKEDSKYMILITTCVVLIVFDLIFMINRIILDRRRKGAFYNKLNKILKSYDSIIVNVEKLPSTKGKTVINVTTFEELLDAEMELRVPINFEETEKGSEAVFMIIANDTVWMYTYVNYM